MIDDTGSNILETALYLYLTSALDNLGGFVQTLNIINVVYIYILIHNGYFISYNSPVGAWLLLSIAWPIIACFYRSRIFLIRKQ